MKIDFEQSTPEPLTGSRAFNRARGFAERLIEEVRYAVLGLRPSGSTTSLEEALAELGNESLGARGFRISVMGRTKSLNPGVQKQIYLIAREALVNALRHSGAASIEAEVEYLATKVRVVVRDNGTGIDPEMLDTAREGHWGLREMRERAKSVGAEFGIWSSKRAGTEVVFSIPNSVAMNTTGKNRLNSGLAMPALQSGSAIS